MIVDASVALKWVVRETDSEAALELLGAADLAAPDLIFSEIVNGLWKKWRRGELTAVPPRLRVVADSLTWIEPSANLFARATALAIELSHPAYDCFYLVLAEARGDLVVTADERFLRVCAPTPYRTLIGRLGERGA